MDRESIRHYCLSLPHVTEVVQWGDDLVMKVAGKMFLVMALEPSEVAMSFKATPETFYELQETEGVFPAPYLARAQWLALERFDTLRDSELRDLIATSYRLVCEKLPKKLQAELAGESAAKKKSPKPRKTAAKRPAAAKPKRASR